MYIVYICKNISENHLQQHTKMSIISILRGDKIMDDFHFITHKNIQCLNGTNATFIIMEAATEMTSVLKQGREKYPVEVFQLL